jgi:hypothetical protein
VVHASEVATSTVSQELRDLTLKVGVLAKNQFAVKIELALK